MNKTVGMIGMGIMGGAMARNLAERGWSVFGFDTEATRCAEAAAGGVNVVPSAAAVAEAASLIITSLPSPAVVRRMAEEIAGSGLARRVVAECSTLALEDKQAFADILAKAGHLGLDCPLSGTGAQCAVRDLVIYASGDPEGIAAMEPVFADIGKKTTNVGPFGNGSRMKYVANHLVAINNVASAEAMLLGVKAGLDPHQIVDLVNAGAAGSVVFGLRAPMMADRVYEPATMRVSTWKKDMTVISAFARALDCPTPMFGATESIYAAALSQGLGALDTAAVYAVYESLGGEDK